ncbi:hypothetical protein AGMMS50218_14670 [Actinomycetota bacterium]|nr:hypothetical protein AGMMS50218_14670 [Actinomycetota bacterium]
MLQETRADRPTSPERRARARAANLADVAAYHLMELRKAQHLTQSDVGARMGVTQRRISAIEHGDIETFQLDTVRAYVEALGGTVKVVADFGDRQITVA